jgi:glycosyltransferase involved in cell wall biosynthesis
MKILVIASWKSHFFHREAFAIQSCFNYAVDLVYLRTNKTLNWRKLIFPINNSVEWQVIDGVKSATIDFYRTESNSRIKRFLHTFINRKNFSFVKQHGYDLVHLQSLNPAAFLIYDLQYFFGRTPLIFTEHNQFSLRGLGLKDQQKVIKIIRKATLRLAVSKDKIRQFAANGIHADFEVIGNCIDSVYAVSNSAVERNHLGIVHVGAFDPYKDQVNLFEALKLLDCELKDGVKIKFTWLGYDGWGHVKEEDVKKFVADYEFNNINVCLEPFTHKLGALKEKYEANGLYVVSSVSEGLSVAMLEAMACGMYVVSTRCGGSEDVINDENGVLVPIKDSQSLAEAIHNYILTSNSINRVKISENILNDFNVNAFALKLKKQYDYAIQMNK